MDFIEGILRISDLFSGLNDEELEKLLSLCREETYKAGAIVFNEGNPCHVMYILESGKVALEMNLHIGRTEEKVTIETVTRGGCLCCSGLIDPHILTATGRTLEKTELIAIDTAELESLFQEDSGIAYKTMNNLAKVVASRLEHVRETLGHILAIIFHDIKAPLAAVESVNRLMLSGYVGDLNKEQKDMLQTNSKRLSDLLGLVSNIIDISRADIKEMTISEISLRQVVEDSMEMMRPLAEEKGLKFRTDVEHECYVHGDGELLKQVLINLLSNAIKFTPNGGTVEVRAKDEIDHVQVEVVDTGKGVSPEELPKIFDDFYRGLDLAERGAGLGLSVVRRVIEAHRGKVWAASPCPGSDKGSQFVFTLPKELKTAKEGLILRNGNPQVERTQ
jgi:signal transduction histidine kinase